LDQQAIQAVKELLSTPKNILLTTHRSPDGDAIGSSVGMYRVLKKLGHTVNMVVPDPTPDYLKWMENTDELVVYSTSPERVAQLLDEAEVLFSLDYNAYHRMGKGLDELAANAEVTRVLIDHHQQPDAIFDIAFSDTTACSTAQMVYEFWDAVGELDQFDAGIANALYCGIMTDTGSFRFPSTTSYTHRVIADLIDRGAENVQVHQAIYDNNSFTRLKLMGYTLSNKLEVIEEYNVAILSLTQAELNEFNYKKGDTEGFVNQALSIGGVRVAIFIKESDGIVKMSLRSKGDFSVNQMARDHFNGGGHINAAGGASGLNMEDTIAKVRSVLPQYKAALTS
jgi:phosphoesterase RecJ-like protein